MDEEPSTSIGRKVKNEAMWKICGKGMLLKKLRVKGKEYIDYKGRTVPATTVGTDCR